MPPQYPACAHNFYAGHISGFEVTVSFSGFRVILQTKVILPDKWKAMAAFVWHRSSCAGLSFRATRVSALLRPLSSSSAASQSQTSPASSKLSPRTLLLDDAIEHALPPWSSPDLYQAIVPVHHLVDKEDQQVLSTLEKICGIPRVCLEMQISNIQSCHLKEWRQYSRGEDLFISGLGSFDIEETYRNWVASRKADFWYRMVDFYITAVNLKKISKEIGAKASGMKKGDLIHRLLVHESFDAPARLLEIARTTGLKQSLMDQDRERGCDCLDIIRRDINRGICAGTTGESPYWFPHPTSLRIQAYFPTANTHEWKQIERILQSPKDSPPRQHLIKYDTEWLKNLGSIDELEYNEAWPEHWESLNVRQLVHYIRDRAIQAQLNHKALVRYDHLLQLSDSGKCRVLRTSHAIAAVGIALKNCAARYADKVNSGKCLLVAYYEDSDTNKPYALGMYTFDQPLNMINGKIPSGKWTQIYLSCNQKAPKKVHDEYDRYTAIIRSWLAEYSQTLKDENQ